MRLISGILIIIALFAIWNSFEHGTLRQDSVAMIDDIRQVVTALIPSKDTQNKADKWFEYVEAFISGTNVSSLETTLRNCEKKPLTSD
ncbi:MAG: hypothetical protein ABSB95_00595 [Dissulfurispiraceae bacterium]